MVKRIIIFYLLSFIISFTGMAQKKDVQKLEKEGYAKLRKNDYSGARDLFFQAIKISPDKAELYYDVACSYALEGKIKKTLEWIKKSFEHDFNNYTHILYKDPDMQKIRKFPEFKKTISSLLDNKIEEYLKYIEQNPANTEYYFEIARIYAVQREKEKALKYLKTAYEKGYNDFFNIFYDPDFEELRGTKQFEKIIDDAFQKNYGWKGTVEQKIWGLMNVWAEAKFNFAFFDQVPELNWDKKVKEYIPEVINSKNMQEYYLLLQELVSNLRDGHTGISFPRELYKNLDIPPVEIEFIENRFIIVRTGENEEIKKQNVYPGLEILSIDNTPVKKYFKEKILRYMSYSTEQSGYAFGLQKLLKGPKNSPVKMKIRDINGNIREITLSRNSKMEKGKRFKFRTRNYPPFLEMKEVKPGIIYFNLATFSTEKVVKEFEKKFNNLNLEKLKGIIIDVRYNTGGSSNNGYAIISHFIDKPLKTSRWKTRKYLPAYRAWRYKEEWYDGGTHGDIEPSTGKHYQGPLVVLIGSNTFSAAEDFLVPLDYSNRALLVGQKTGGSTGQPLFIFLPGGGSFRVCTKRDTYPDGKEFVGFGISPDIEVHLTVKDVYQGFDRVLEKGIEVVENWEKYEK